MDVIAFMYASLLLPAKYLFESKTFLTKIIDKIRQKF